MAGRGRRGRGIVAAAIVAAVAMAAPPAGAAAKVRNGGFETGDETGWNSRDRGEGSWEVYEGNEAPISGNTVPSPSKGTFGLVSDMTGPGAHIIHQVVRLRRGERHVLRLSLFWRNQADSWHPRPHFRFNDEPNQQFRIDVLKPGAPLWTLNRDHILKVVFRSKTDTELRGPRRTVTANLSRFAGRRVRIRFAEVDNQSFLHVGIDHVRITA